MNNHVYKFSNETRVQENKGGIGVEIIGIVTEIKMIKWSKSLKEVTNTYRQLHCLSLSNIVY